MLFPKNKFVLASSSPSRKRLLSQLVDDFIVMPSDIDESVKPFEKPEDYVRRISAEKALACPVLDAPVLSADTIVAVGRRILRKAQDADEVLEQMRLLSGRRHRVLTAVTLKKGATLRTKLLSCHVKVKILHPKEIQAFIASNEWQNVAVYKIEGFFARYICQINGLASTVQGLPLFPTYSLIQGLCKEYLKEQ